MLNHEKVVRLDEFHVSDVAICSFAGIGGFDYVCVLNLEEKVGKVTCFV